MADTRLGKSSLIILFAILLVAMVLHIQPPGEAVAEPPQDELGRYQISAWASYAGERTHHSGYYVLDTVTGKVVDKGHEVHGISGTEQRK